VLRGALGSVPSTHNANEPILDLKSSVIIVPFAFDFFRSKASTNFLHSFSLPDVRISAAEFFVTNSFGNSQTSQRCYTLGADGGLRTLSGGQFTIQVAGYLATQQNAAPALTIEQTHAVRDVRATLNQAPAGYNIAIMVRQNGLSYCSLTVSSGSNTSSPVVDGIDIGTLQEGANLTLDVSLTPVPNYTGSLSPGRDLTVTIRL
jgi:hypothetical protein